jgi:GntR family transcriptional regulator
MRGSSHQTGIVPDRVVGPRTARDIIGESSGGLPRYLQLATLFKGHISSGTWQARQQIPTVDDLSKEYGIAPGTISRALGLLEEEGLIQRFRAKGTFVTGVPHAKLWCDVRADWTDLLRPREGATIELLAEHLNRQPPTPMHGEVKLSDAYRYLKRRHARNGVPFYVVDLYIAETLLHRLPRKEMLSKTAFGIISAIPNLKIGDVHQTLTVGLADMIVAELLGVPINSAVAHVQRSVVGKDGVLMLVGNGTYRGDQVRLDLKLR